MQQYSVPFAVADGQDSSREHKAENSRILSLGHPLPRTVLNGFRHGNSLAAPGV